MEHLYELGNPNDLVIEASILLWENLYYVSVITKYSQMKFFDGTRTLIYKSLRGSKIGFGIHYMTGAKWIRVDETKD